jgi:LacI family transcriptional regulator
MKRKPSIHDIARELDVSATAISFVLNGKAKEKRVSEELEKKILDYIHKVGFSPNLIAKSLRTGKSNIIGMLVEDISDPFFSSITRWVETRAFEHGYKVFFSSTENETEKAKSLIRIFRERQVDGYIIAPTPGIEAEIRSLMDDHIPVVLFDRHFPQLPTINVLIDNYQGAYDAVDHLRVNGYKNIGLVTLDSKQTQMTDRLKGYTEAIKANKGKGCVLKIPFAHREAVKRISDFLTVNKGLDAVVFLTNYLAISGLEAIAALGLSVPEDLAIVGFDDNTHFSLFSPSITAVAQPVEEIAGQVILQLIDRLRKPEAKTGKKTIVLPTQLIVRNSSGRKVKTKPVAGPKGFTTVKTKPIP